ncbi:hypothetical protein [Candidatus Liberibacter americanus]|uniref:hypothetical protein n=1 Tax=Candidatus Liberibacter americanus TaxID=309868 RepID=UPI0002C5FD1D|nr:hypothetical protein [Candidatus Liberibacter americanus]EMS35893.1 hypothetical protein G653_04186 [Candidatus Liberibacter americanus PW_SP]
MSIIKFYSLNKRYSKKNKFSGPEVSLQDVYRDIFTIDFLKYGRKVIKTLRMEKPEQYLRMVFQILSMEQGDKEEASNGDQLTDAELYEIIRSLEEELQLFADSQRKDVDSSTVEKAS